MDASTVMSPNERLMMLQREKMLSKRVRELHADGERWYAAVIVGLMLFIVPIAGFSVIAFGSDSIIIPLSLTLFLLAVAAVGYRLLLWMLTGAAELGPEPRRTAVGEFVSHPAVTEEIAEEDFEEAAFRRLAAEVHGSAGAREHQTVIH